MGRSFSGGISPNKGVRVSALNAQIQAHLLQQASLSGVVKGELIHSASLNAYTSLTTAYFLSASLNSNVSTLLTGLVSYWKLGGNSTDELAANSGTDTAMTYGAQYGRLGSGALLNGTSSFVNLGSSSNLNFTGAMSFAAWVKVPNATNYYMILTRGPSGGATYEFRYELTSGSLSFIAGAVQVTSVAPPLNCWHHVCFTRSAANAVLIYIDGVQQGSGTAAGTSLPSTATFLGKRADGYFLSGNIDDAGIWNRPLTLAEVQELYANGAGNAYPFLGKQPGTWTYTGSMIVRRGTAALTMLNTGKVLIAGGFNPTATQSECELYDPALGTWAATGSRVNARYGSNDILLPSGKVLSAGGYNAAYFATCELYDPVATTWATTGAMSTARYQAAVILLANGKVLAVGGENPITAVTELYTPGSGTWANTTGNMAVARQYPGVVLLPSGKVLAAGGNNASSVTVNTCELYDPTASTWSSTGAMSATRVAGNAILLQNGKVLIAGGTSGGTPVLTCELYDPTAGTWSSAGSITVGRDAAKLVQLNSGKVLLIGGRVPGTGYLSSVEMYDPVANSWSVVSSMSNSRGPYGVVLLASGQVLVAGGIYSAEYAYTAELYTP